MWNMGCPLARTPFPPHACILLHVLLCAQTVQLLALRMLAFYSTGKSRPHPVNEHVDERFKNVQIICVQTTTPEVEARTSNNQIYPLEEEWQNPSHWGLDLPSYDDALDMPKVDNDAEVNRGVENSAYDQSSLGPPPDYEPPSTETPPNYEANSSGKSKSKY